MHHNDIGQGTINYDENKENPRKFNSDAIENTSAGEETETSDADISIDASQDDDNPTQKHHATTINDNYSNWHTSAVEDERSNDGTSSDTSLEDDKPTQRSRKTTINGNYLNWPELHEEEDDARLQPQTNHTDNKSKEESNVHIKTNLNEKPSYKSTNKTDCHSNHFYSHEHEEVDSTGRTTTIRTNKDEALTNRDEGKDDSVKQQKQQNQQQQQQQQIANTQQTATTTSVFATHMLQQFSSTIEISVPLLGGARATQIECQIQPRHVYWGLKGASQRLHCTFPDAVRPEESTWTVADGVLCIYLDKQKPKWSECTIQNPGIRALRNEPRPRLKRADANEDYPQRNMPATTSTTRSHPNPHHPDLHHRQYVGSADTTVNRATATPTTASSAKANPRPSTLAPASPARTAQVPQPQPDQPLQTQTQRDGEGTITTKELGNVVRSEIKGTDWVWTAEKEASAERTAAETTA